MKRTGRFSLDDDGIKNVKWGQEKLAELMIERFWSDLLFTSWMSYETVGTRCRDASH